MNICNEIPKIQKSVDYQEEKEEKVYKSPLEKKIKKKKHIQKKQIRFLKNNNI